MNFDFVTQLKDHDIDLSSWEAVNNYIHNDGSKKLVGVVAKSLKLKWSAVMVMRDYGIASLSAMVPPQTLQIRVEAELADKDDEDNTEYEEFEIEVAIDSFSVSDASYEKDNSSILGLMPVSISINLDSKSATVEFQTSST